METPSERQHGHRRPRAGRPKMRDAAPAAGDEADKRRARMRLAQRTYRGKKDDALNSAQQKSEKLEVALRGMLGSFETLRGSLVHQSSGNIPVDIALHLSKTAIEIASFTHNSGLEVTNRSLPNETHRDMILPKLVVAERFARASMQRTAKMLAIGLPEATCLPPTLLERLNLRADQVFLSHSLGQISDSSSALLRDIEFPPSVELALPRLFRQIEGGGQMIPRLRPPQLQRLKYGHTRTWVQTDILALLGEWLEAVDVEEYLSERGISLRDDSDGKYISLQFGSETTEIQSTSSDTEAEAEVKLNNNLHPPVEPVWRRPYTFIPNWQNPSIVVATDLTQGEALHADWTIFGKQQHELHTIPSGVFTFTPLPAFWNGSQDLTTLLDPMVSDLESDIDHSLDTPQGKITINVDNLIEGLAARATCIGSSPGIRREGVDDAIREAVMPSTSW